MEDQKPEQKSTNPQRHRLLVKPEEMGLTGRIRKALLEQEMGLTQKIQKAMAQTRDKNSSWYVGKNLWITIGILFMLMLLLGYGTFRSREINIVMKYPDQKEVSKPIPLAFYEWSKLLEIPSYTRQITFRRVDVYGNDFTDKDFEITTKEGEKVSDPRSLLPGVYNLRIKKEGYKQEEKPLVVGDVKVEIPVELTPIVEQKRRLQLYLNDSLQEGKLLEPDDVRIKSNNKSIREVAVRTDRYVVVIEKAGYHSKEMELFVPENGIITEKITLDYKKRAVKFLVDDGLSEKGQEPELTAKDLKLVQEGKEVEFQGALMPGYYDMEIHRDGYSLYKERVRVVAAGDLLTLRLPLKTLDREILIHPNYEVPPADPKPDKSYLKDIAGIKEIIPITAGLKVPPKKYWVIVEKDRCKRFQEEIFVAPGSSAFVVKAHMPTETKDVILKIRSDFEYDAGINPDELGVDMRIGKTGYVPVDWGKLKQALPSERKQIEVPVFLETIPRRVVAEIASDIMPGLMRPNVMTLTQMVGGKATGQSVEIKEGTVFKPARYVLNLKHPGYESIVEEIIITPSDQPYVLRKEMKAERRELVVKLDTDYDPEKAIRADEMLLNREIIEPGIKLKPGKYRLVLRKRGFKEIERDLDIKEGSEPYLVKERMEAKPRRLVYDVKGEGFILVKSPLVTFDGNETQENAYIPPKKGYLVKINVKGYEQWLQNVPIEPDDNEFVLKALLNAMRRRIILTVNATFPLNKDLMPVDKATLGDVTLTPTSEMKPGKYSLTIVKSAYQPLTRVENIEPDEAHYKIEVKLVPTPRNVNLDVGYQIAAVDIVKSIVRIESEDGSIRRELKNGDKIEPNIYRIEVIADGYKKISERVTVEPSESVQFFKYMMAPEPRKLVVQVVADYPSNKDIRPDRLSVDGNQGSVGDIRSSIDIIPGKHTLVIEKAGYLMLSDDNVNVPAGIGDYEIKKQLISQSRVVTYRITDAESGKELVPDAVTLGGTPVMQSKEFKPGRYRFKVEMEGYEGIGPEGAGEDLEIPVGDGPYSIARQILPSSRLVNYEIKGDYKPAELLKPQEITLNGNTVDGVSKFKPSDYDLVVYVPGYERLVKKLKVEKSRSTLTIHESLNSKARKIVFNVTGTFPANVKLAPDKVTFNDKEVVDSQEMKPLPGGYRVVVNKLGYLPWSETVQIEPSENEYTLTGTVKAKPRRLEFELDSDFKPNVFIDADVVTLNGKEYKKGEAVDPGTYQVELRKLGFANLNFTESVDAAEEAYKIKKTMKVSSREVLVKVTTDYAEMPEIRPQPDLLRLSDRDIEPEEKFIPGTHELVIRHRGYNEVREQIEIVPGEGPFNLERKLYAKKRMVRAKISYDVPPPDNSQNPLVRMTSMANNDISRLQDGDEYKPGWYMVSVEKEGYETLEKRMSIPPDDVEFNMALEMIAKTVEILIKISYDNAPPDPLGYTVTFVDPRTGIGSNVTHGKRIKPGAYELELSQPGYVFKNQRKKIYIPPGVQPFLIEEILFAKPRSLSFEMIYRVSATQTTLVRPYQIFINYQPVRAEDSFAPGKYAMMAKFNDYKTVQKDIIIPPGEGPYVADVELTKLEKYEFRVGKKYADQQGGMMIDGVRYALEIYVDGAQVEAHQISFEGAPGGLMYGSYFAAKEANTVRIVVGFYHDDSLMKPQVQFRDLTKVDIGRLISHLTDVSKSSSSTKALMAMDTLMKTKDDEAKIKKATVSDREKLVNFLRDLEVTSANDQNIKNAIQRELQK
jgi:hypothetical protein